MKQISKKIKSLLVALLAALVCFALCACGEPEITVEVNGEEYTLDDPVEEEMEYTEEETTDGVYVLYAEDADLSATPGIVLEPDAPPYNLGGWKSSETGAVAFYFSVEQAGMYRVAIDYSKDTADGEWCDLLLYNNAGDVSATLPSTGEGWSNYQTVSADYELYFESGDATLYVERNAESPGEYAVNLRSVTLTYVGEGETESGGDSSMDNPFLGRWMSFDDTDQVYEFFEDGTITFWNAGEEADTFSYDPATGDADFYGEAYLSIDSNGYIFVDWPETDMDSTLIPEGDAFLTGDATAENPFLGLWDEDNSSRFIQFEFMEDGTLIYYEDDEELFRGTYDPAAGTISLEGTTVTMKVIGMDLHMTNEEGTEWTCSRP